MENSIEDLIQEYLNDREKEYKEFYCVDIIKKTEKKVIINLDFLNFELYKMELNKYGIEIGEKISKDCLNEILLKKYNVNNNYVYKLLATKDFSRKELERKLKNNNCPYFMIPYILDDKENKKYIDEERTLENYINYYKERYSLKHLKIKLLEKGIDKNLIEDFLFNKEENYNLLRKNILSKINKINIEELSFEDSNKLKNKIINSCLNKGFELRDVLNMYDEIVEQK